MSSAQKERLKTKQLRRIRITGTIGVGILHSGLSGSFGASPAEILRSSWNSDTQLFRCLVVHNFECILRKGLFAIVLDI
jgi:hypothetical protein